MGDGLEESLAIQYLKDIKAQVACVDKRLQKLEQRYAYLMGVTAAVAFVVSILPKAWEWLRARG